MKAIHKTAAAVLVATMLQGCGDSGDQVPMLGGQSAFSCRDLNMAKAQNGAEVVGNMISATVAVMDQAYTEDTPIQHFYRSLVRKDLDYALQHRKAIEQACASSGDLSLNDATSQALNSLYAKSMTQPRWATCRAFNDGTISYDAIRQEMVKPSAIVIGGDSVAQLALGLSQSPQYGADYVREQVEQQCEANPDVRIWTAIGASLADEKQAIMAEYTRQREAEEARIAEERRQAKLAEYGSDLTKVGKDNCRDFDYLVDLAHEEGPDTAVYAEAVKSTIYSVAEPLEPHQKAAFDKSMAESPLAVAQRIIAQCGSLGGSNKSLHELLMETEIISQSKSDAMVFLETLRDAKQSAVDCTEREMCRSRLEANAAHEAVYDQFSCERKEYREGIRCFSDPQVAYDYQVAMLEVADLSSERKRLEKQSSAPVGLFDLGEDLDRCKGNLIDQGLRGEAYAIKVKSDCEEPLKEALKAPIRQALAENAPMLEAAKARLETLASRGEPKQPN